MFPRSSIVVLLSVALVIGACGGGDGEGASSTPATEGEGTSSTTADNTEAEPTIEYNGARCMYRGPETVEAGLTRVSFVNTSGQEIWAIVARLDANAGADLGSDVVDWWVQGGGENTSSLDIVVETAVPAEGKTVSYNLTAGDMAVICLSDLTSQRPTSTLSADGFTVGSPTAAAPTTTAATTTTTTLATTTTEEVLLVALPEGDAAAGAVLFETPMEVRLNDACSVCHSATGEERGYGPVLDGIGAEAGDRVEGLSAEDYLQESIVAPRAFVLDGWAPHMPTNYAEILTEQQLADLIAHLLQL